MTSHIRHAVHLYVKMLVAQERANQLEKDLASFIRLLSREEFAAYTEEKKKNYARLDK